MSARPCRTSWCSNSTGCTATIWKTITNGGEIIKNGYIELSDRPGIGLELNEEVAKAHQYPGTTWFA